MSVYEIEHRLRSEDVNMHRVLRTSALFRLMQESAIRHTEELGAGREATLERGLLWMVTLQTVYVDKLPRYDELVTFKSWPGEAIHLLFPRYYHMLDETGATLLKGSTYWALVDEATRKMVFPEKYGIAVPGESTGEECPLPRPFAAGACSDSRLFTAPFSYVDLNGHMNNTRYFDLAEDCIDAAAQGRQLKEISAEYSNEVRYGESFTLSWGGSGGEYYVAGENEKKLFRLKMSYR